MAGNAEARAAVAFIAPPPAPCNVSGIVVLPTQPATFVLGDEKSVMREKLV